MNDIKKAFRELLFVGKVRTVIIVILFITVTIFAFGTYGALVSVRDGTSEAVSASTAISYISGWMVVCAMLVNMEHFTLHYSVMSVLPAPKGYGVRCSINRTVLIVCCMFIGEVILLLLGIIEYGLVKALSTVFVLAASLALMSALYSFSLWVRMKKGRFYALGALLVLYSVDPLVMGVKGKLYSEIVTCENDGAVLTVSIIAFALSVLTAVFSKNRTIKNFE